MSEFNKSVGPYYDDYNSSKQYTHMLALPGRVAQAREITQIQSIVKDIIRGIGDSILKDGNVIEGCQVLVSSDKSYITVTSGKVYIHGMVLPVQETRIDLDESDRQGTLTIGFKLDETLITEVQDETLKDPAQGFDNFNQPGCHRIKSEITIVKNDPSSAILTTLIDGEISVERYAPEYDVLTQTLARRTYDESGSYVVEGLSTRTEANQRDSSLVNVVVDPGKAYVLGYEVGIPNPRRIAVKRATEKILATATRTFSEGQLKYPITMDEPIIASIASVNGLVVSTIQGESRATGEFISIYTHDDSTLPYEGEGVVRVYSSTTEYVEGVNYSKDTNSDSTYGIRWITQAPDQYFVDFRKRVYFQKDVDYKMYVEVDHSTESDVLIQGIEWLSTDDDKHPLSTDDSGVSYNYYVNYNRYLARRDIVYLDSTGMISVVTGLSARSGVATLPETPVNTLPLAYITHTPNGGADGSEYGEDITEEAKTLLASLARINVSNVGLTRFTMQDIQRILTRLKTVEFDQAVLSLNDDAKSRNTSTEMRGIFSDPMIDFTRVNYNYTGKLDGTDFKYGVVLDVENNMCYLPVSSMIRDAVYKKEGSTVHDGYTRTVSLRKSDERVVLSQPLATKGFLVNPYTMFPQSPEISIEKNVDTWYDDTEIQVFESIASGNSIVVDTENAYIDKYNTRGSRRPSVTDEGVTSDTIIGTQVDKLVPGDIVNTVVGEAITFIRPGLTIKVTGSQFPANTRGIRCYFDDILVPLTVGDRGAQGEDGTIITDDRGRFTATFQTPEKVRTGIKEVRVEVDTDMLDSEELKRIDGYLTSSVALYQAEGYKRTLYRTVTQITSVLVKRTTTFTTTHYIDPVGQTFVLDSMTLVSGVNLYFKNKPIADIPITCEIREVVNGNITANSFGLKTLQASEVEIDNEKASKATRFKFDTPILLESNKEYAVVVRSVANSYELWVAELGSQDVASEQTVVTNPYLIGVMMSSSNNSSWTSHQTTDIKFDLIEDIYENSSEVLFENIPTGDELFSRIYLSADSIIPEGTSIEWSYLAKNSNTNYDTGYQRIYPNDMVALSQLYDTLTLKASLSKRSDIKLSPIVSLDTVGVSLSKYGNEGYYVTREILDVDDYNNLDIVLDSYIPNNTSLNVYVSTTGSNEDWTEVDISEDPRDTRNLDYGWKEVTYRVTDLPNSTRLRVMVKLSTSQQYRTPAFRKLRVIMS